MNEKWSNIAFRLSHCTKGFLENCSNAQE